MQTRGYSALLCWLLALGGSSVQVHWSSANSRGAAGAVTSWGLCHLMGAVSPHGGCVTSQGLRHPNARCEQFSPCPSDQRAHLLHCCSKANWCVGKHLWSGMWRSLCLLSEGLCAVGVLRLLLKEKQPEQVTVMGVCGRGKNALLYTFCLFVGNEGLCVTQMCISRNA